LIALELLASSLSLLNSLDYGLLVHATIPGKEREIEKKRERETERERERILTMSI
jgi:hypothetical protein